MNKNIYPHAWVFTNPLSRIFISSLLNLNSVPAWVSIHESNNFNYKILLSRDTKGKVTIYNGRNPKAKNWFLMVTMVTSSFYYRRWWPLNRRRQKKTEAKSKGYMICNGYHNNKRKCILLNNDSKEYSLKRIFKLKEY